MKVQFSIGFGSQTIVIRIQVLIFSYSAYPLRRCCRHHYCLCNAINLNIINIFMITIQSNLCLSQRN